MTNLDGEIARDTGPFSDLDPTIIGVSVHRPKPFGHLFLSPYLH
jgi:hypothetical protein